MTGWQPTPLGEILSRSNEIAEIQPDESYKEITVKLWGKGVLLRGVVEGATLNGSRRFLARCGQLILSRIDARNGAIGIVPEILDGAIVSNDFPLFAFKEHRILPAFFEWLSKTQSFVELCQKASEGTTNRVRLQEDRFLNLEIPLPPLPEQRRIVARIEELAAKINEARTLRQKAIAEAAALWHSGKESAYRKLCKTFGSQNLGQVCHTITDGDHNTPRFSDEGVRFIFVGNVSSGRLHFENTKRVSPDYFRTLKPQRKPTLNDILYSAVGATLGIAAVVDTDEPFCFQRHVAILKPDSKRVESRFIWHMLGSRTVFDRAWASTTGSAQPTVPLRAIRELPIPAAPLRVQRCAIAELDALQQQVDALKKLHAETASQIDVLLPSILDRAFNDQL